MKIAIISDVHGNYPALRAVLEKIDEQKCDKILSLGDVTGYYCMVNQCLQEFRDRNIVNLMGNHDSYVLGMGQCPRSYTVNRIIEYQKQIITSENLAYLKESPLVYEEQYISARHGGWNDPVDEYIKEFDFSLNQSGVHRIFCSGHTHVQKMQSDEKTTYFNPGSVGQPRDHDCRAAYAIVDENNVHLYRVVYDIDWIAREMEKAGFEERTYSCLYYGMKIGENND